jgi:hypothetical protein
MTIGEQSVRAIIPNLIADTSGDSLAHTRPAGNRAAPRAAVLTLTNRRREFTGAPDNRDLVRAPGPTGVGGDGGACLLAAGRIANAQPVGRVAARQISQPIELPRLGRGTPRLDRGYVIVN